jgi:DNA ligase-1
MSNTTNDESLLNRLEEAVKRLQGTTKILEKKKILKEYENLQGIFNYVYNSMYVFHVTSKNILKYRENTNESDTCDFTLQFLLDQLKDSEWTGHEAIRKILGFIDKYGHEELVLNIIDKDLKIRMGEKQINAVFPGLIESFEVALAETYDKQSSYFEKGGNWFISRKLDGIRCICIIKPKEKSVKFYSREGIEFLTLGKIKEDIINKIIPFLSSNLVFDGEVCLIENNMESFAGIMKLIKKKDFTIPNPQYILFDCLSIDDFKSGTSTKTLSQRLEQIKSLKLDTLKLLTIKPLPQYPYTEPTFFEMSNNVVDQGWEGLMLRKDTVYEGKRTKNLLKVKKFFREEYKVIGIEKGKISNNGGKYCNEDGLKTAKIMHKNCVVDVGSGFNDEERLFYYKNPSEIIGKIISVQYFEETITTKNGVESYSLRFPTFKGLYGNKRDM